MSLHFILQGCSSLAYTHSLTHTHTRTGRHTHTQGLIFQGLVLFGQHCANRRCNTSPDSSQKQEGGETRWPNKQPTLSHRERRDFSGFTETQAKTHTRGRAAPPPPAHTVCNSSLSFFFFFKGLGPLATFLNVCLSSLKTGAAAGVNSSQQAVYRLPLSSVIFYYLIKKQEIRFPLSEKELILLSQSNLSREREMERGGENGGGGRERVSE